MPAAVAQEAVAQDFGRREAAGPVRRQIRTRAGADNQQGSTPLFGRVYFKVRGTMVGTANCRTEEEYERALEFAGSWLDKCGPRSSADAWGETFVETRP